MGAKLEVKLVGGQILVTFPTSEYSSKAGKTTMEEFKVPISYVGLKRKRRKK